MIKLYRARSILYRRQILQENIRWKALDEILFRQASGFARLLREFAEVHDASAKLEIWQLQLISTGPKILDFGTIYVSWADHLHYLAMTLLKLRLDAPRCQDRWSIAL